MTSTTHRFEILIETIGNIVLHSESQILIFVQLYNGLSVYVHTCNYRSVRIQFQQYFSPFLHNPISNSLEELKNIGRGFITYHHICSSKFFFFFSYMYMYFHSTTKMAKSSKKNPYPGSYEVYNFGRLLIVHHNFRLRLFNVCQGVEKTFKKEICNAFSYIWLMLTTPNTKIPALGLMNLRFWQVILATHTFIMYIYTVFWPRSREDV